MPDKQDRYRKRKSDQGFQRVEVLVPEDMATHLKAYARALRDAHALGLEPPLFDGMRMFSRDAPHRADHDMAAASREHEQAERPQPNAPQPSATSARKTTRATKPRPDFSGGLIDE